MNIDRKKNYMSIIPSRYIAISLILLSLVALMGCGASDEETEAIQSTRTATVEQTDNVQETASENVADTKDTKHATSDDGSYTYSRPLSYNEKLNILTYYLTLERDTIVSRNDYDTMSESALDSLYDEVYAEVKTMYNVTMDDIQIMMIEKDMEIFEEANSKINY